MGGNGTELGADGRRDLLAERAIELARGLLIADNPFLAAASGVLAPLHAQLERALATDGTSLMICNDHLLRAYAQAGEPPVRDYAHTLMHCILLHPFVGPAVEARAWDLAADIVAERLVAEVCGPRGGTRGDRVKATLTQLEEDLPGPLTTERLYRALRGGAYEDAWVLWEGLFRADDHSPWYGSVPEKGGREGGPASEGTPGDGEPDGRQPSPTLPAADRREDGLEGADSPRPGRDGSDLRDGLADEGEEGSGAWVPAASAEGGRPRPRPTREDARERWSHAAKSLRIDLETLSRARGAHLGGLVRELKVDAHESVDYREFLRQFAVEGEHLHVSDDEFDYVFYTYGLSLYGDLPLVEPLEYRNERRIRDFAIVIDTSSSVTGRVVQRFVDATFDVLSSEASFFCQVNIHIVMCDARVQSDVKITSLADLDRWRRNIRLVGFGGTDFRPAFRYVDQLLAKGEFDDLQGLIYFTDGWGVYPERMPPYKCAFVFYDRDHRPELVPAWAIQLVLRPGELEGMGVC